MLFIQHCYIEGFEREIVVAESNITYDFSDNETHYALCCVYGKCTCSSLHKALTNLTSNTLVNITTDVKLSSIISVPANLVNVSINGYNNSIVLCCNSSGGLHFVSCYNCTIGAVIWKQCGVNRDNKAGYPVLQVYKSSNIIISNCYFHNSVGQAIVLSEISGYVIIEHCHFLSNKRYKGHGTAIHYTSNSISSSVLHLVIASCNFSYNGGAESIVYIGQSFNSYIYLQNSNFWQNKGTPIYLSNGNLLINGNIEFYGNIAENGGGILISNYSTVRVYKKTTLNFRNNTANNNGGAIFLGSHSSIVFGEHDNYQQEHNTFDNQNALVVVKFQHNGAKWFGQDIYIYNSNITFGDSATIGFNAVNNNIRITSAMYMEHHATATFEGNSNIVYENCWASDNGGAVFITDYSNIIIAGNSVVKLYNNKANKGGALYITHFSHAVFKENCILTTTNSKAYNGGTIYITDSSSILFSENSTISLYQSRANSNGGTIYATDNSSVIFKENSVVTFNDSIAYSNGGVMYIADFSCVTLEGFSVLIFLFSRASNGGAMYITNHSKVKVEGNSVGNFSDNVADTNGAAVYIAHFSNVIVDEDAAIAFVKNQAYNGGAMYITDYSSIIVEGNSAVKFSGNIAQQNGGVVYINYISSVILNENSTVTFDGNKAYKDGIIFISDYCNSTFKGNSIITFNDNKADNGGVIYINFWSIATFKGNSTATFNSNTVLDSGGAVYINHKSTVKFEENSAVIFNNNSASFGGSVFIKFSEILIGGNTSVKFTRNTALQDGGAMYLNGHSNYILSDNSIAAFKHNTAGGYGGAMYALLKENSIKFNSSDIHFTNNKAGTAQNSLYINVLKTLNKSFPFQDFNIITKTNFLITTSPSKLILYDSASCISNNYTECSKYLMNHVMLGQQIKFSACVLDYFGQPTNAVEFLMTGMDHPDYNISGSNYKSISCNSTIQGLSIVGNLGSNYSYNYSVNISSYNIYASQSKIISISLTVEISQCYPGFQYSSDSQKCECYNTGNVVFCSHSNSTIKKGYWFGTVSAKPTVSYCPNDYCNFTCCQITNDIYHLSPVRENQCKLHRSGNACGNCVEGYSLSFDSPECVDIENCTIGQTILVITLSILYWITIVVAIFVITRFKVAVGSFYVIIYYYSVVDLLLNQMSLHSNGLYTPVNVMSSLAKLTPHFLGHLCLMRNMSGIDQQFIHYLHPTVITLILIIMIIIIAKRSLKVSLFFSRDIIQFICFLLLLSYTSVATTSVMLLRPLIFVDVDEVYIYLSPDIQYFHGRHIAYVITAIVLTIMIVIGLPLLLLLEPFLNRKINFVKIKPVLDKFQGCYKDEYRYFSSYYMICRIVIIIIVTLKNPNDLTAQYLLISICSLISLIHLTVKPYAARFNNTFDGIMLQLTIVISAVPLVEFTDNYDKEFVLITLYFLIVLPAICFFTIKLWINRNRIINATHGVFINYIGRVFPRYSRQHRSQHHSSHTSVEANDEDFITDVIVHDYAGISRTIVSMYVHILYIISSSWLVFKYVYMTGPGKRSYLHKIHLFILWHLSPVLYVLSQIC